MSFDQARAPRVPELRLAVAIATKGRPHLLREVVAQLDAQTRSPDRVLVCGTEPADLFGLPTGCETLQSPAGLPRQRNAMLDRLEDCDIVLFLDDDFLVGRDYLAATVDAFASSPSLVGTTGYLVADHARGPGLTVASGQAMLDADSRAGGWAPTRAPAPHCYGCNMAIRLAVARRHELRFDERLPLYAWSEDMDFSHRLARYGELAKLNGARGVHLGTKEGRSPGRKLGYSQVANPIYLFGKGSYSMGRAARSVGRNVAMNALRSMAPEPWVDRRGRLRGNMTAAFDLLRGRLTPERMLEL